MADDAGPRPWSLRSTETPNGLSLAVLDKNGGVVCLLKGPRKQWNGDLIIKAVNGAANG